MLAALVDAMFSPEGLIVGTAWVLAWAVIVCLAFFVMDARERRQNGRRAALNVSRPPQWLSSRGEG